MINEFKKNIDGTEKRVNKSFKIEESLYIEFQDKLKNTKEIDNIGLTAGSWIRKQIILYMQNK